MERSRTAHGSDRIEVTADFDDDRGGEEGHDDEQSERAGGGVEGQVRHVALVEVFVGRPQRLYDLPLLGRKLVVRERPHQLAAKEQRDPVQVEAQSVVENRRNAAHEGGGGSG